MPLAVGERRWGGRVLALAAGAPLALAFPEPGLWWLAWVGLVPLLLLVRAAPTGREGAVRAWLGGAGFFTAVHLWLLPKVGPFVAPASLALGLVWLPWGGLAWALLRAPLSAGRLGLALLLVPSAFVAAEYVRAWEGLGGPFGLLGSSQWNQPELLSVAALGGVWAVSFLVMAANVAVAAAAVPGRPRWRAAAVAAAGVLAGAAFAHGALRPAPPDRGSVRLALVQPGVIDPVEPRFRASEAATVGLAGARPDLVVWGESSLGLDPTAEPAYLDRLTAAARAAGADVLANVDARRGGGGIFKTSLLLGPDGVRGRYDKMRMVPFGEYIPLRPALGWLTRVTEAAAEDRSRGRELAVLRSGGLAVGPLVCFESSFPDLARNLAARGAELVVVQSATTTFQESWGPEQHASLAAVRAVESGRPVAQAALSGVSAAFDARGRRLLWQPTSWRGAATVELPLSGEVTPYVRWGDWLPLGSLALTLVALLVRLVRRPAARPPGPAGPRAARPGATLLVHNGKGPVRG